MALDTSSYLDLLSEVTINATALTLGLAVVFAVPFVLWALFEKPMWKIAHSIGIAPQDSRFSELQLFVLALLSVIGLGGYIGALTFFSNEREDSLLEACMKAVMVIVGSGIGVGICGGVLVVLGWLVGVRYGTDGDGAVGKTE